MLAGDGSGRGMTGGEVLLRHLITWRRHTRLNVSHRLEARCVSGWRIFGIDFLDDIPGGVLNIVHISIIFLRFSRICIGAH